MKTIQRIALALVIIGGINWGLIGLFQWDLVATLFGGQEAALSRVVYTLVGISALVCLSFLFEPMDETDRHRDRGVQRRNINYGTEFDEEADFSNMRAESETRNKNSPQRKE